MIEVQQHATRASLGAVGEGDLVFTGPDGALVGRAAQTWVRGATTASDWADQVAAALDADEVALGALSFEPGGEAVLHRLTDVRRPRLADLAAAAPVPAQPSAPSSAQEPGRARHRTVEVPSPAAYASAVRTALGSIEAGVVEKVVLGRYLDVQSDPPLRLTSVLHRLLVTRPGPYVFAVPVPDVSGVTSTVLGASPELLVRRRGDVVEAMPLAGSVPRSSDPAEDAARRDRLQASDKDLREHAYVIADLVARLTAAGVEVTAPERPIVVGTDTLWHLATPLTGRVRGGGGPTALHLAQALAPTPAVGGTPTLAALDLIEAIEGQPRGYLAGAVGWVDGRGDGEFALALRSGVLSGPHLRLFAGAGIVAGSDPDSEVRETGAKLATMVTAVGL